MYSVTARLAGVIALALCHSAGAYAQRSPTLSTTVAAAEDSVRFGMLEARFAVSAAWLLSIGAAYLDPGTGSDETQLRLGATGTLQVGSWTFDNRHLLSFSSASVERYRMRVRAIRPGLFGVRSWSVRAFDETYFDFDSKRLLRNNVAIGFGLQMSAALSGELYQVREMNRARGDDTYVLALLTFRFGE
jgi:hypothetical protein